MLVKIRRYHLIFMVCGLFLLTAAIATFSLETRHSLKQGIAAAEDAPLEPVVPETPPAGPAVKKESVKKAKLPVKDVPAVPVREQGPKTIALTFDDGPHPQYTERLLKVLAEHNVKATFFVVGKQAEKHPDLIQKIFQEGHELANHTYSHRDMRLLTPDEIGDELDRTGKWVESVTAQRMRFFRPPGGQYDADILREAESLGYRIVLWNIFPQDHTRPDPETLKARVLSTREARGVVLLHSGIESTVQVLPDLIEEFKSRGYGFVTVSQMAPADVAALNGGRKHALNPRVASLPSRY